MSKYKVEYVSESGTYSDNELIGIFETLAEAKKARREYIISHSEEPEDFDYYENCIDLRKIN